MIAEELYWAGMSEKQMSDMPFFINFVSMEYFSFLHGLEKSLDGSPGTQALSGKIALYIV